jgi:hypothetical protein
VGRSPIGRLIGSGARPPATVGAHIVRITHDPGSEGYCKDMLAVVVLVPIALMILACSLERFEALTTRVATPRAPRGTAPAPTTAVPAPHLRLVPGTDVAEPAVEAEDLRRAS